MRNKEKRLW